MQQGVFTEPCRAVYGAWGGAGDLGRAAAASARGFWENLGVSTRCPSGSCGGSSQSVSAVTSAVVENAYC